MPIDVVARQPLHLQADDDTDFPPPDADDEVPEARPRLRDGAGPALIVIQHHDPLCRPPYLLGPRHKVVLPASALAVVLDLVQRGLPHVDVGHSVQMRGANLRVPVGARGHG